MHNLDPQATLARQSKEKGISEKVNLVGLCGDAVGTTHKGKRWSLMLDQWAR